MGYDLHITRKDCWAEEEDERSISLAEWQSVVDNDPEIILDPENPHEDYYIYIRDAGNWPLWFNPRLGNIYTKNPPEDVIQKIIKLAKTLRARVQGDDQEFYDLDGNMLSIQYEPSAQDKNTSSVSYERYIWYFAAVVFIISIIWHLFIPGK
ncbi:MAG: hypothetical protein EOO52_01835 [Gammaproteobacteria bacterium]|nr:MAG: hypothetical protein EOO52_01835 [Gammaproteobacteria bacterium]